MRILQLDPSGIIFLLNDPNKRAWEQQLRKRIAAMDAALVSASGGTVSPVKGLAERIVFLPKRGFLGWLNLLNHSDVLLDTFPFGAYTSTLEAMSCCGTPAVTLPSHQNKMLTASGFYSTLGVGKGSGEGGADISLIAGSIEEYASIAVQVADLPEFA